MKPIDQLTKDEITSKLNAIDHVDNWDNETYRYREQLIFEYNKRIEEDVENADNGGCN